MYIDAVVDLCGCRQSSSILAPPITLTQGQHTVAN